MTELKLATGNWPLERFFITAIALKF